MKIKRNTPTQLILENNPIWLAVFVTVFALTFTGIGLINLTAEPMMGAMFVGGGLFFGVVFNMVFVRRTQLILDATARSVELRRRSWFGYTRLTWDLQHLGPAHVQTSFPSDRQTHRPAIDITGGMDAGTHPLTLVYSSGAGARRAVQAINTWRTALDTARPTA